MTKFYLRLLIQYLIGLNPVGFNGIYQSCFNSTHLSIIVVDHLFRFALQIISKEPRISYLACAFELFNTFASLPSNWVNSAGDGPTIGCFTSVRLARPRQV
ncbi:MAG: hypothetical protein R3E79_23385 [Caldilineaceae bacterium]